MPIPTLAVVWYYRDQWKRIVEVSEDGPEMGVSYDAWLRRTEQEVEHFASRGVEVHKVYVDVNTLLAWASRQGLNINRATRTEFCNFIFSSYLKHEEVKGIV